MQQGNRWFETSMVSAESVCGAYTFILSFIYFPKEQSNQTSNCYNSNHEMVTFT